MDRERGKYRASGHGARGNSVSSSNGVRVASVYERMFGARRNRRPGRPAGLSPRDFVFPVGGKDPDLAKQAKQRAIAVVLEEQKERLAVLYDVEYKALVDYAEDEKVNSL